MTDEKPDLVKKILCGEKSPLGDLAERLAGAATECWCCSFWRGAAYGALTGLVAGVVVTVVLL